MRVISHLEGGRKQLNQQQSNPMLPAFVWRRARVCLIQLGNEATNLLFLLLPYCLRVFLLALSVEKRSTVGEVKYGVRPGGNNRRKG